MTDMPRRGLAPHLLSCFAGAATDNVFRFVAATALVGLAAARLPGDKAAADHLGDSWVQLAGLLFLVPFVLLAPLAGSLGDRLPKHRIMRAIRLADLLIIALGAAAAATGSIPLILATLALLGGASAFFSTVKLSALPELVEDRRLAAANAWIQAVGIVAILGGKAAAAVLLAHIPFAGGWSTAAAVGGLSGLLVSLGLIGAWLIPPLPAQAPATPLRPFAWIEEMRVLASAPGLLAPALSVAGFWSLGAAAEILVIPIASHGWGLGPIGFAVLQLALAAGIILGSALAPWLLARAHPAGLPVLGALLTGGAIVAAGLVGNQAVAHGPAPLWHGHPADLWLFAGLLVLAGTGGGLWEVPLLTVLQERAPAGSRNRTMAAMGVMTSVGMAAVMGVCYLLTGTLGMRSAQEWVLIGGVAVAAGLAAGWIYRVQVAAWALSLLVRAAWDLRVQGLDRMPAAGGCVLAANHLSYADGLALLARCPRPCRFLIHAPFLRIPGLGFLLRAAGAIPIDPADGRQALVKAIDQAVEHCRAGGAVLVFPEGKLSRSGQIDAFKGGVSRIAERAGVPVLPVFLHGLHGTWMGRAAWRDRPRWRRRVSVRFGAPMAPDTAPAALREAVLDLGWEHACAVAEADRRTLGQAALARLRRHPFAIVVTDQGGGLAAWRLAGAARALVPALGLAADEGAVGLLLPPGRAGCIANLAVALAGRTAVNLNHTAGAAQLERMCALAGVRTIVSSSLYRRRIGDPALPGRVLALEELLPRLGKARVLGAACAALALPARWLARGRPEEVAALVFSSGTTGDPKGVQLTHRQILAQVRATRDGLMLHAGRDTVLSPLPLFHSFGLVPGMWLGLAERIGIAAHPDPRDAEAIGALAAAAKPTFVISTPTFIRGWMRRIDPAALRSLRFAVAGAERCPAELKEQVAARYQVPLMEGYGCTELAPVVAVNLPDLRLPGDDLTEVRSRDGSVGRPIAGVSVFAVDPADHHRLPAGAEGLLVVRSPSRMLGYLGRADLTARAFVAEGYATGDIGRVDPDGFIHITGRLARFAKVGGEMVPLDHVEAAIQERLGEACEVAVAAVADSTRGERLMVLHTGWAGDWTALLDGLEHLPALWRPRAKDVRPVPEIPRLGTGKRDLGAIKRLAGDLA